MNSKVILSICIPTFNRRDCVYECVTKILDNYQYDDIEVIVSDNCSVDGTEEKLSAIRDKRFKYFKNDVNIKWINLLKVMSYSIGQFSMLMSDEDDVKTELLRELINFLVDNPRLALVKSDVFNAVTRDMMCYKCNVSSYYDKITAVLTWAYMSGIIYNNHFIAPILKKLDFTVPYERYLKIIGDYPHMWLALMIAHRGHIVFYHKVLAVHAREYKCDCIIDGNKAKEYTWSIDRRFKQTIAIGKSFKHLQISKLDSKEKVGLYCQRVRWIITHSGLGYYKTLYGKDYELLLREHHPEDVESLLYLREQNYNIARNIYLSYKITNLLFINSIWENRWNFMKDYVKNWLMIVQLYYDTVKEYFAIGKYIRNNGKVKGDRQ